MVMLCRMTKTVWFVLLVFASCVVAHGEGARTSVGVGDDVISVVVVKGTPYEMGYAFGSLMREEARALLTHYLEAARTLGDRYTNETLDAAWESVKPHTDKRFEEEVRGLADGCGLPFQDIIRAHMVPVVSDYACSGVAAWGEATANGHLYQFRNLDFTTRAGLQDHPAIVVYLPNEGIPHANITFAGYVGCHTGINAKGVVLGEKGETPKRDYPFDLNGTHFSTLYRTILYDAGSLDDALDILKKTRLIKKYYFYFGDGQSKKAAKIKVEAPSARIWFDDDPADELQPNVFKNIIYHTMNNEVAYQQLKENYGKHDHTTLIKLSKAVASKNGNLVNVVYDATALELWVGYAQGQDDASTRPYVPVKLKDYFNFDFAAAQQSGMPTVTHTQKSNPIVWVSIAVIIVAVAIAIWVWKR